jgi:hypothetical protein
MFKKPADLEAGDVIVGNPYCTWTLTEAPTDAFKVDMWRIKATPSNPAYETVFTLNGEHDVEVAD